MTEILDEEGGLATAPYVARLADRLDLPVVALGALETVLGPAVGVESRDVAGEASRWP
jgi:hypothetical protein